HNRGLHPFPTRRSSDLRCREVADDHVVFGAELEEALQAGRRVLGALAFVAVRQEQYETAALAPLLLGRRQELVEDDLCAVGEVAELRLPEYERRRIGHRVPVLEGADGVLGEQAVVNEQLRLTFADVVERDVLLTRLLVVEDRVAVAERAAPRVLAAEPHARPFRQQRAESKRLGKRPVDLAFCEELLPPLELADELLVYVQRLGQLAERADGRFEGLARRLRLDGLGLCYAGLAAAQQLEALLGLRLRRLQLLRPFERFLK